MSVTELIIHPELEVLQQARDGYSARWKNLYFVVSVSRELDGKRWLHASMSRSDKKLPTYANLLTLKRLCVGEQRTALQVFPPTEQHIDLAGRHGVEVLHLWSCLDGDVTPDFSGGTGSI